MALEEQDTARLPRMPSTTIPDDRLAAAPQATSKRLGFVRELLETILFTVIIFVAVRALVINYRVDGDSMVPSLRTGEYLLVNKAVYFHVDLNRLKSMITGQPYVGPDVVYLFEQPERGDIIVLTPPVRSDKPYIKRVIALAGEQISIYNGQVYVNGQALSEPYIAESPRYTYPFGTTGATEFTVPPGSVFVLGDNRNNSSDSHVFGQVPLDSVIGKAFFAYWPTSSAGLIPHERYNR